MKISITCLFMLCMIKSNSQELVMKVDTHSYWMNRTRISDEIWEKCIARADHYENGYFTNYCTTYVGLIDADKREGEWTFETCEKFKKGESMYATVNYAVGILNGDYVSYHDDTTIKSRFTLLNGDLAGPFTCYMPSGIILYSGVIVSGSENVSGWIHFARDSYKKEKEFSVEALRKEWLNEVD